MNGFSILICILLAFQLNAQRFEGYLALGSNITEANLTQSGNRQVGTRIGFNVGPGVSALLSRRWEVNLEMLYSQNANYVKIVEPPPIALNRLRLHFIGAPLTIGYRFNIEKDRKENFYKRRISAGIAYARLFGHAVLGIDGSDMTDAIRFNQENAFLFTIAATSFFRKSLAVNGKGTLTTFGEWTVALRLLYYI